MSPKVSLLSVLLIFGLTGVWAQRKNGSCTAPTGPIEECSQFIYSDCQNATYVADARAFGEQCSPVSLFWDAPHYNMTILFKSPTASKSNRLCLRPVGCVASYRTDDDDREVVVDWDIFDDEPICFAATSKTGSVMKFRFDAGERWHCYGTFIRYFYRF